MISSEVTFTVDTHENCSEREETHNISEVNTFGGKFKSVSDTPSLDCQLLLSKVLGKPKSWLLAHNDYLLTNVEYQQLLKLIDRRAAGEPIAYILGCQGFWDMDLFVTPATLIPRPETELLVEVILANCSPAFHRVVDLGTGSGAIAIALQRERPNWEIYASDYSHGALRVAKQNAAQWAGDMISFVLGDWMTAFNSQKFDLVVSNPPYIQSEDKHLDALGFEPRTALVAQNKGLEDLRAIIFQSSRCLKPSGQLVLEHGFDHQPHVIKSLLENGYSDIREFTDVNKIPRAVIATWQPRVG